MFRTLATGPGVWASLRPAACLCNRVQSWLYAIYPWIGRSIERDRIECRYICLEWIPPQYMVGPSRFASQQSCRHLPQWDLSRCDRIQFADVHLIRQVAHLANELYISKLNAIIIENGQIILFRYYDIWKSRTTRLVLDSHFKIAVLCFCNILCLNQVNFWPFNSG